MTGFIASAAPLVIDALLAGTPQALTDAGVGDVIVTDGLGDDASSVDRVAIGAADPFSESAMSESASTEQEWANTLDRDESGWITCQAYVSTGSGGALGQKHCRDRAFAIVNVVADWVRTNRLELGAPLMWIQFGGRTELLQVQDSDGSVARVTFQVGFRARL